MSRRRIVLLTAFVLLAGSGFAGSRMAAPLARPALGFVAKVVCSNVFVGGATPEQALADLPDEPIARAVRTHVDTDAFRVTASVPLVAARHAMYSEGAGCTLVTSARDRAATTGPTYRAVPESPRDDATLLWPDGDHPAASTGVDTARLHAALRDAFSEPDPDLPRRTRAVVVVHGGHIIAERYADGYGPHNRFGGWSMTKSVTSALVGILVGDGRLDIRQKGLLHAWNGDGDPRAEITLHHLLTMSSGLDFDESYTPSGAATRMLFDADDAAAVAAASPLAHEPGAVWAYSSGTTNIISAIVRDVLRSDSAYHEFPRRALFDRIGMHSAVIEADPSGTLVGSSFMYATARDWARFGLLFLNDGMWGDERVLPEGWVEYSVAPAAAAPLGQYGAQWWLNAGETSDPAQRVWPDLPPDVFWASGFEGQSVVVVPSQDLVIVRLGVTADDRAWQLGAFIREVMGAVGNAGQP